MFDETWMERKIEHDSEFLNISDFFSWVLDPDSLNRSDLIFNRLVLRKDIFNIRYLFSEKTDYRPDEMEKYDRGYIPRNDEFSLTPRKRVKFSERRIRLFEKLLAQFENEGIEVILVQCPEFNPEETAGNPFDSIITKIAGQYDLKNFDYNEGKVLRLNQDKTNFFNWSHLNEKGAAVFSQKLSEDLKEILHPGNSK